MPRKTPSMPIGANSLLATMVALQMLVALPAMAASPAPLRAVDRNPRANWIEAFDWGGGARFVFDLKQSQEAGAPSLNFLAGGAPEFSFGCADQDPTKSYWRFRVGATPPGSGITSRDEIAHEKGMKYYFGAPGMLVLLDEVDKEIRRTLLTPRNGALETAALTQDDVQAILNASAIRAETPRIFFESATSALKATIDGNSKLPCATR
ncbi:hypothetical protein IY145_03145 [Methylosinus sp. H3A]|uniref:hypothetical protein n=1 Tax=Methylosinus sp. H3A TaxID=2785786 RepID=UPI0018C2716A|nr:hypothetical protein [Methylosinus sp. H3A]MBG0808370.1 hypothetical protein [Methylosinus sp. H3A]